GPAVLRRWRPAGGARPARRRRVDRGRPEGRARLRHQRIVPDQGRARRPRQGGARRAARWFHQLGRRLSRRTQGDERRLRPDGHRIRRQGPARAHHGRCLGAAAQRGGRSRGLVRGVVSGLDWLTARPIAHRGLHGPGAVENTPTAFTAAIANGYAIETDLQITADGEAVVHHDANLGRLNEGSGALAAMTAAELKRVPFKDTADRIITFGELLDLVAGGATLAIELKSLGDGDDRLPRRAA